VDVRGYWNRIALLALTPITLAMKKSRPWNIFVRIVIKQDIRTLMERFGAMSKR
jgi:hypothetical protein|tara:strand:- start:9657 stop:9818 length:162 start_codon:yes stop_codon:yes gene_type:complete